MIRRLTVLAPVLALAAALAWVDLPLFTVAPGTAREVVPLIDVDGRRTYAPEGRYLLTTVSLDRATVFEALVGWVNPAAQVVPEGSVVPEGQTEREYERRTRSSMDESKIAAAVVALERLTGYPEERGRGVLVQFVVRDSPADGVLFPGDVIESVDGRPVEEVDDVGRAIREAGTEREVTLEIETDGERSTVRLRPARLEGARHPVIGVVLVQAFPFDIRISSDGVGGPSAGLMWALALVDLLSPGDLTAGRVVAGTGEITLEGDVRPVGGVEHKVVAAERAGAEVFLVPRQNSAAARAAADTMRVVPVGTLEEALRALEEV